MILFEACNQREDHQAYQNLSVSNLNRQYDFPQARDTGIDMVALGKKLNARKQELKRHGIPLNAEEKLMLKVGIVDSPMKAARTKRAA